ncbi:1-deoxy-D-xylulose-5-phosphate synthase [Streptomyces sp. NPDC051555]|uniref:1-deoxy-D-xylulose-5-phosphate synthase n=1 Tax=Streptomyces sp. NPDC051555 TaxID=3365657 RepID=UPI0037AA8102
MTAATPIRTGLADLTDLEAVRAVPAGELPALARQIREFLVEKVTTAGGHLGPNLGVVELTLALHRVFDSPHDAIVFDTGHQAYVHKLLTGRSKEFDTLRQPGGLSGYPSRSESVHDLVENSHASTALSYADGLAKARQLNDEPERAVVAVIGDGALTGGMAWEALNNLGAGGRPVTVVVNDNGRSYDPTVGALAGHLAELRGGDTARRRRNVFTDLGFAYLGPVDGHDTGAVEDVLRAAKAVGGPVVVHVATVKGKGYGPAESDEADRLHAVGPAPAERVPAQGTARPSWTSVFSRTLLELGARDDTLVAITAAMGGPTGLAPFAERFPERFFDVGIAEQHAVTSAAGLAMGGMHPVVAIYATFLNRAFDQVLMDVALHRLPVTFVLDRAGITGPDGPSHHGMWDASLLSLVPGLRLAVPRDAAQLRQLLGEAIAHQDGPTALRFPKGATGADLTAVRREGVVDVLSASGIRDVLLVAYGPPAAACFAAAAELSARGIGVTVADPRWAVPVPLALLELADRHRLVVTVEDNSRTGGLGSQLAQSCRDTGITTTVVNLGLPRHFITHGDREQLLAEAGLSAAQIVYTVLRARAGKTLRPSGPSGPSDGSPA